MRATGLTLLLLNLFLSSTAAGPTASVQVQGVAAELRLNKSLFGIGEPIETTLTLTNARSSVARFQFPTGQMYDFMVTSQGQRVWQWSMGKFFTQAFTTLTLKPGDSRVFTERWNQRNAHGQQVPPGEYSMIGVFPPGGAGIGVAGSGGLQVRFTITKASSQSKPEQTTSVTSRATVIDGTTVGEVLVNHRLALRIGTASGGLSAAARAEIITERLKRLVGQGLTPEELTVVPVAGEAAIMWRDQLVVTADANHARLNHTTPRALGLAWLKMLTQALSTGR